VALLVAILLAVFVVPAPWGVPLVVAAALVEAGEAYVLLRWSRRRRPAVGVEALVGATGVVDDDGWVRIAGERWRAESAEPLRPGDRVEVTGVSDLVLSVRGSR
jgi:membrane-bound serine protease (ClpP class)